MHQSKSPAEAGFLLYCVLMLQKPTVEIPDQQSPGIEKPWGIRVPELQEFTLAQIAELLSMGVSTLRKFIRSKELTSEYKVVNRRNYLFVTRENLLKFLEKHKIPVA